MIQVAANPDRIPTEVAKAVYSGKTSDDIYRPEGGAILDLQEEVEPPVFANLDERLQAGKNVFRQNCAACHQPDGDGVAGVFPPLAESDWLRGGAEKAVEAVLNGLSGPIVVNGEGYNGVMPSMRMSDTEIANVLTFVYSSWNNPGDEITVDDVRKSAKRNDRASPLRAACFSCAPPFLQAAARRWETTATTIWRRFRPASIARLYAATDADGGERESSTVAVTAFWLDRRAATNDDFLAFVRANPRWRKSTLQPLFADVGYLAHWRDDFDFGAADAVAPVVNVSWFAARAYCRWRGKKLPTVAQWERAAAADETRDDAARADDFRRRILEWYASPAGALPVARSESESFRNLHGVYDMHGLVWEWTRDFNNALITGASRSDSGVERNLFCGGGAVGSSDFTDYGAFMRFAFRGSLRGDYAVSSLGFRCARDTAPEDIT